MKPKRAPAHPSPSSCSSLLWNMSLLSGMIPLHLSILGPWINHLTFLAHYLCLWKQCIVGIFGFFLFNYISVFTLIRIDWLVFLRCCIGSLRCWIIILCMLVWLAKSYRMSNVQGKNRWCMDIRNKVMQPCETQHAELNTTFSNVLLT